MVMLEPPGVTEDMQSRRHVVDYMRNNFDSWLEFANAAWGLGIRPEDLLFVCGTLKTTQWAVAAFQGHTFRNKQGSVSGQLGSIGNVGITVQISDQLLPNTHHRTGPQLPAVQVDPNRRLSYPGHETPATLVPNEPDQCLFIHFYKMKRRFWWKEPMQAGAGPHQLPPGSDNQGSEPMSPRGYEFVSEGHGRDDVGFIFIECNGHWHLRNPFRPMIRSITFSTIFYAYV